MWYSRLSIQHCYCSGSSCFYGIGSVPGPGTSTCFRCGQKKKKKKKKKKEKEADVADPTSPLLLCLNDGISVQSHAHLSKPRVRLLWWALLLPLRTTKQECFTSFVGLGFFHPHPYTPAPSDCLHAANPSPLLRSLL